jgi:NTP-dependent ternary system trypsin peptidase co-occuring protein
MSYVIEIPVEAGGQLLVQASEDELPGGLELASLRPGEVVARTRESVEAAIDQIKPAINAVAGRLKAMSADEVSVEFGIVLGAETGAVIAKGSAEVHFTVTLTWKHPSEDNGKSKESGQDA